MDLYFMKDLEANCRGLVGGLQRNFYLVEGLYVKISCAHQRSLYLGGAIQRLNFLGCTHAF
jgi:hypothetical protein